MDTCCICYYNYGLQEDGSFLCKDGICNSEMYKHNPSLCTHYVCERCCLILIQNTIVKCPLCREDWTEWIHSHYYTDSDYESDNE